MTRNSSSDLRFLLRWRAVPVLIVAMLLPMQLPAADADMDGMEDAWEQANGLNPAVDDALLDPDEDGLTNVEELPGKAGEISRLVNFFKKIKDVGDACSGMSGVANTCMNFASDIAQDTCYNCCMGIYNSYGNEIGGIGYFVCHNICSEF